jgi:hypothetical protein
LKSTLEEAAKNLSNSGGEFLARLDLVRQTWKEQADTLASTLQNQMEANQALGAQLQGAAEQQACALESLASTLGSMQAALAGSAVAVHSLEAGLRGLAESPIEQTAAGLVASLAAVSRESERISSTLVTLTASTQLTAETQASVHEAVKQLNDLKLIDTLESFRDSLVRHATLVDKLNAGLKITIN